MLINIIAPFIEQQMETRHEKLVPVDVLHYALRLEVTDCLKGDNLSRLSFWMTAVSFANSHMTKACEFWRCCLKPGHDIYSFHSPGARPRPYDAAV
jgi:hypothetical protein